jgi:RHS repeat-associated protein
MSASAPSQTVFSIGYDFHVGNGTTGTDNGNVWGITNYKDNTRNQSFTYDSLNRLSTAQNAGTDCTKKALNLNQTEYWGNSYGYDAWGNLTSKTVTKCSAENLSAPALVNNQISGYGYDAAGNMTSDPTDGGITLSYDQENRIQSTAGYTYTYDADGNRVKKTNGTTGTLYWYMSPGIVAESDLSGTLKSEYVFFDGERVARRDLPAGSVAYYFSDHLKTASVITDSLGNIKSESDYYPWGGELQFINNDSNHYKFTGKERDETGLDYFGARYYSNGLARFITPDWAAKATAVPYAEFSDPQSLNLYTYVRNVPTSRADQDGHQTGQALTQTAPVAVACAVSGPCLGTAITLGAVALAPVYVITHPTDQPLMLDALNPPFVEAPPTTPTNVNAQTPPTTSTSIPGTTTSQSVDQATKDKIKDNAGGKCEYCGKTTTTTGDTARGKAPTGDEGQTDHYKPKSKGGTDDESNLVHACRDCNGPGGKGNADPTDPNDAAGQKWRLPRMENDTPKK